jgi:hypothetical protein
MAFQTALAHPDFAAALEGFDTAMKTALLPAGDLVRRYFSIEEIGSDELGDFVVFRGCEPARVEYDPVQDGKPVSFTVEWKPRVPAFDRVIISRVPDSHDDWRDLNDE